MGVQSSVAVDARIRHPLIARIAAFLGEIGLRVDIAAREMNTFLPGVAIENGTLMIDETRLLHPGDLLHEAGHLAMLRPEDRIRANGNMGDDGGLEMSAIAWSYAAAIHLGISPSVVFHEAGYKGGSQALLENFAAGRFVGVPLLEWAGLTVGEQRAKVLGVPAYPAMLRWLRAVAR
jgi:hypothetical protein